MTVVQGLLLGVVQGVTEFLPISSSGHLVLAREIMELPQTGVLFDVLLHVATLGVVCLVFRRRLRRLTEGLLDLRYPAAERRPDLEIERRTALLLVVTTVATVAVALGIREAAPPRSAAWTGAAMVATAVVLTGAWLVSTVRSARDAHPTSARDWRWALGVGVAQGLAVLPGLSRAGVTIAVGTATGADRGAAAEYSFVASIPAIVGALVISLGGAGEMTREVSVVTVLIAAVAAALTGYVALRLLLRLVAGGRLQLFAFYLVPVGIWGLLQG